MFRGQGHGRGRSFISDQQIKSESIKSKRRLDGWPYFCTTTNIASVNNSNAKTLIEYDIDETLDIKEEIVQDKEGHQLGNYNLLSEKNQLDKKYLTAENSDKNIATHTLIEYDLDEALEIKEEIIQDQENVDQRLNKKDESKSFTSDTREGNIMTVKKPRTPKKNKIQESKSESKKKYKCEKCARIYAQKRSLYTHKKFKCGVVRQFSCEFCDKRFKVKTTMNVHVNNVHLKKNSKTSPARYNCDKCSRSYSSLNALCEHKRVEHSAVKQQFICDVCGFQARRKCDLSKHITSRHFKKIQKSKSEPIKKYSCEKCARSYAYTQGLSKHKRFECGVIPQFSCEFCAKRFKVKGTMSRHVNNVHLQKNSKTSQARHNCDKCSRSYRSVNALNEHKRLHHAAVKQQFICDVCGFQTKQKYYLAKHITSRHFQKIQESKSEPKMKYKCEKCARSYVHAQGLYKHKKFECDVIPQFSCEFCSKPFKLKGNMNIHIRRVHRKTDTKKSLPRHNCDKCSGRYSSISSLNRHKSLEHAVVKPRFNCDLCSFKTKCKHYLSIHMVVMHVEHFREKN